ncbi:MAG: stage II sporulation protein R [Christensenellales bacterium]|nr:stage II sporulation protein R [Christensenellales bacterium]
MKKRSIFLLIILCLSAAALLSLTACDDLAGAFIPRGNDVSEQVVRIHIRANSNDAEDQAVKLAVRDEITEYLTLKLDGCKDKSDALERLAAERDVLTQIAQKTLYENGYDYKASVELKMEHFPERVYDGYVFPEGDYDALMIYLGEGAGDNWWCVAFPPLCFVPDADGEDIVYKSWVKEMLDKIFG